MNPRDAILAAVRANLPAGQHDRPDLPAFPVAEPDGPRCELRAKPEADGRPDTRSRRDADPLARTAGSGFRAQELFAPPRRKSPAIADLAAVAHPKELADVDVAVVRAAFAIAETGSVLFTEAELQENALAYLAQHLVVLLDPADIVPSVQDAYRRRELHEARYAVFHTGPSATADIEGVLIHGAQGVRSLTVVLLSRSNQAVAG